MHKTTKIPMFVMESEVSVKYNQINIIAIK